MYIYIFLKFPAPFPELAQSRCPPDTKKGKKKEKEREKKTCQIWQILKLCSKPIQSLQMGSWEILTGRSWLKGRVLSSQLPPVSVYRTW